MCNLADLPCVVAEPRRSTDPPAAPLSGFEARCLLKRIAVLREQAQLAVLGADAAREAMPAESLKGICRALHEAELQIAQAEDLAARELA
ncbi:hypothetical protein [Azohydromonas caseinilytica]|uniref:Uncharacterized protein n=1 Tax=Azohydromonas caseinilytica TaxID=2728836 RepID=A0A848FEL6_9BURK|nr:hypothetical protein [Azohydromonas caseinilytica]NML17275.1 hypothetical protein [Azohydromonas caseinilytica]